MRYVFGDSYGDLGNRELATDAASDNRYFQSLAAQRASDAQAAQQQQAGQEYQLKLADLGQRAADTHYTHQLALMHYLAGVNQFGQTMGLHQSAQDLANRRFDWQKTQPTGAEIYTKERDEQLKAIDANTAQQAENAANLRNQIEAATNTSDAATQLPSQEAQATAVKKATTWPWWTAPATAAVPGGGVIAAWLARRNRGQETENASFRDVSSLMPPDVPADFNKMDYGAARSAVVGELGKRLTPLLQDLANYDKQGITGYLARDPKSGKWVSTYRPRFNFGPMGTRMVVPPNRAILRFDPMTGSVRPGEPVDVGAGE